jgi:hypothetical protein
VAPRARLGAGSDLARPARGMALLGSH